ncbi:MULTISPECIES: YiiX/YebB-like N1pC/P60 family cysteine hydrolase [Enterobacter]|uniref:YiiX/YebB-like N1pC/P60 family cysteine hydrolase n=1 Tax=Enterobacter TaxID=547 RepID=UPI00190C0B5C|nr:MULTISPECIES: YiiX/YebB-like N1pC/P60 family cysteine hydrolase [Enterobacter]MBO4150948.1 hypothetical protein [Enterobacter kobei]MCK7110412.1 hypothetical protein [Enterobacter kobei]UOY64461.1 hypothetical protein LCD42_11775 [Enterobacter kobei]
MNVINGSYHEGEQYFILDTDQLKIGDIILEHGYAKHSDVICSQTGSRYSHAMIYVGGTIIEATLDGGVFSRVPNRSVVRDINDFKVLRLKETADVNMFLHITDYARSLLGSKYSVAQALSVKGGRSLQNIYQNSRKQFCSRLVAQSYAKGGVILVQDVNFCSPADIERSDKLFEVPDAVRLASAYEAQHALAVSPHSEHAKNTVKFIDLSLKILKKHGVKSVGTPDGEVLIMTLNDISQAVYENSSNHSLDEELTQAMHDSGYLDHIDIDRKVNSFRYNYDQFKLMLDTTSSQEVMFEVLSDEFYQVCLGFSARLQSYINGRENHRKFSLKYTEAELLIARTMLQCLYDRIVIIEKCTANKNFSGFKDINKACNDMLKLNHSYNLKML